MLVYITLLCSLVFSLALAPKAVAFEMAAGFAAIEEGDDRIRPGVMLHMAPNSFYSGRFYYYGRDNGPASERTFLLSADRRVGVKSSKYLEATYGIALMNEQINLEFADSDAFDASENNYNVGGHLGIQADLPAPGPLHMSVSWDSHLFLAGQGGLFLATGRKMTISLMMGAKF